MPSPFPGMDPYLETPELWPDVHHELISQIQGALNPTLRPCYVARIQLRLYISDDDDPGREAILPDFCITEPLILPTLLDNEIKEARLEIRHLASNALVTVIEVVSPTNKIRGSRGRTSFMDKRREVLASEVHWVEIDLLRGGFASVTSPPLVSSDYRVFVSRVAEKRRIYYWPIGVRQSLPAIGVPLRGADPDVPLDLQAVFTAAYDHAAYDLSVDYRKEPHPPLEKEDAAWAKKLLREAGRR